MPPQKEVPHYLTVSCGEISMQQHEILITIHVRRTVWPTCGGRFILGQSVPTKETETRVDFKTYLTLADMIKGETNKKKISNAEGNPKPQQR